MKTLEVISSDESAAFRGRFAALALDPTTREGAVTGAQGALESARDLEEATQVDGLVWLVSPAGQTLVIRARSIHACKVVDDDGETVLRIVQGEKVSLPQPQIGTVPRLQSVPNENSDGDAQTPSGASSRD